MLPYKSESSTPGTPDTDSLLLLGTNYFYGTTRNYNVAGWAEFR